MSGVRDFLIKKVAGSVKAFIEKRKEKITKYFSDKGGMSYLGFLIPEVALGILEWVKKNPSKFGAAVGFILVLIKLPKIYKHAKEFYDQDPHDLASLQTVFPVEGVIGVIGSNSVLAIVAALGLRNLWKHAIKDETKDDEKESKDFFEILTGAVKGTTSMVVCMAALLSAINLAAFAMTKKPNRRFTVGNDEGAKKVVVKPYTPKIVKHDKEFKEENQIQEQRKCSACKTANVSDPTTNNRLCDSCFENRKKKRSEKKEKKLENHSKKKKGRAAGKFSNIYDKMEGWKDFERDREEEDKKKFPKSGGINPNKKGWGDDGWEDTQDWEQIVFNSWKKNEKRMPEKLKKFPRVKFNPTNMEKHARIPTISLAKAVVEVGTDNDKCGFGFMIKNNVVLFPKHYQGVTHLYYKPSESSKEMKFPIEQMTSFAEDKHLDGVVLGVIKGTISKVPIGLAPPTAEFPTLVQSKQFGQTTSSIFDEQIGIITYLLDSAPGDCGQPVVNGETGKIVGMHIGISKTNKQAKVAYALGFTAPLLRKITDHLDNLVF